MPENKRSRDPRESAGFLSDMFRQGRLVLRLLGDRRVPIWPKLIVPATIAYLLSPIDLLSDPILGLGQLDDVAVIVIGLRLFIELCPRNIVQEHLDSLSSVIAGSYRVVAEEGEQKAAPQARMIEGHEEVPSPGPTEDSTPDDAGGSP